MSELLKSALQILLSDLMGLGDEFLPEAYATGKAYAAAKSGYEIAASKVDQDIIQNSLAFNQGRLAEMVKALDAEVLSLNPQAYDSVESYMADVERVFNKYANRQHAWVYYSEQPFFDGFLQGSKDVQGDLAKEWGIRGEDVGFTWHVIKPPDVKICSICWGLNGQWFPLTAREVTWTAHMGCRCPEYFTYDPNPRLEGGRRIR